MADNAAKSERCGWGQVSVFPMAFNHPYLSSICVDLCLSEDLYYRRAAEWYLFCATHDSREDASEQRFGTRWYSRTLAI